DCAGSVGGALAASVLETKLIAPMMFLSGAAEHDENGTNCLELDGRRRWARDRASAYPGPG
ncbi:MAG: hypothetical protein ABJ354_21310, partial [Nitratireductor sp.]